MHYNIQTTFPYSTHHSTLHEAYTISIDTLWHIIPIIWPIYLQ